MAIVLFLFWLLLSQKFDAVHLIMGAFSAMVIAGFTRPLYRSTAWRDFFSLSFAAYLPWLIGQILMAALQVAYLVLHPRLPISPRLVRFQPNYRRDITKLTLANSITLTPGTVTVDVKEDGEFLVHALSPSSLSSLKQEEKFQGEMIQKVSDVFESNIERAA